MIHDFIRTWAAASPEDVAIIDGDRAVTVAELSDLVDGCAATCARDTEPGDRIAVLGANSVEFVALLSAVPMIGRTLVPLNVRHTPTELHALITRSAARLLIGDRLDDWTGPHRRFDQLGEGASGATRPITDPAPGPAWIIFTSGTTGAPKGARLTHASLEAAVQNTASGRPLADDDVYLYPFPLFHVSAYNVLHAHHRRRPVVLLPRFDAGAVLTQSVRHGVTAMSLAPTMLRLLLDEIDRSGFDPSQLSLRTISYGASPMPASLLREGSEVLGCGFAQGYGMTELSGNAVFLTPDDHRRGLAGEARFLDAAGYAGDGVQLRLVDDEGHQVPPGVVGEITVAGDQVCDGYLDDPEATRATIVDGWLHTGDLGICDDDGLLHVVDRAKDVVVTGGENVSSREVEDALLTHPDVVQAAVVGVSDARWGEAVTAVVVAASSDRTDHDPAWVDTVRAHVRKTLAGYKVPRRIEVVDALPVNAGGKVDKRALRDRLR